jgi:hypothetical protein
MKWSICAGGGLEMEEANPASTLAEGVVPIEGSKFCDSLVVTTHPGKPYE